jgi:hypothetical protein
MISPRSASTTARVYAGESALAAHRFDERSVYIELMIGSDLDLSQGVRSMFRSIIDWFRVGYPDEAPSTGYSPLLALNGPIGL